METDKSESEREETIEKGGGEKETERVKNKKRNTISLRER